MSAAIGLNLGYSNSFGLYVGLLATVITLLALGVSDADLMSWMRVPRKHTLKIECVSPDLSPAAIGEILREANVSIDASDVSCVRMEDDIEILQLVYSVELPQERNLGGVVREIGAMRGVRKVEAAEPPFYGA